MKYLYAVNKAPGFYRIEPIVVPVVCDDIAAPSADSHFVQQLRLKNKFLADDRMIVRAAEEPELSVLIGSDYLSNILTGEVIRSTEVQGLTAVNTCFGWTLQGPVR